MSSESNSTPAQLADTDAEAGKLEHTMLQQIRDLIDEIDPSTASAAASESTHVVKPDEGVGTPLPELLQRICSLAAVRHHLFALKRLLPIIGSVRMLIKPPMDSQTTASSSAPGAVSPTLLRNDHRPNLAKALLQVREAVDFVLKHEADAASKAIVLPVVIRPCRSYLANLIDEMKTVFST